MRALSMRQPSLILTASRFRRLNWLIIAKHPGVSDYPTMNDFIDPPTDNLYKFFAISGLAFALLALFFLFRQQSTEREQYVTAQVELLARGYVDGTGPPTDVDLRRAYFRREAARAEDESTLKLASGMIGRTISISLIISLTGFISWWIKVQRYEDAILRGTLVKLKLENTVALATPCIERERRVVES
jgi:hypothetical protein